MNIFTTSADPIECAETLDDKRVVKMCLETTQMLCTALSTVGVEVPYKPTHINHPCNVWARKTRENWEWLWEHGMALCQEYTRRFGKIHACQLILAEIQNLGDVLPEGTRTPFVNCARNKSLGIDYTHMDNVYVAYLCYLNDRWDLDKRPPTWNRYDFIAKVGIV